MNPRRWLRRLYNMASLTQLRDGALIEVRGNGFWCNRGRPEASLNRAAELFNELRGEVIVEIGSGIQGSLFGNSVLVWSTRTAAKRILAVDLEKDHVERVRRATVQYPAVEAIAGDWIQFLARFDGRVDLLYLDFDAPDPAGAVPGTGRAESYLAAYRVVREKLGPRSIILIDDTDHVSPWKDTLIVPEARRDGFRVLWAGRQTLLFRKNPTLL